MNLSSIYAYGQSVFVAADRLCASIIGWGYQFTISARCGSTKKDCRLCKVICALLNKVNPNHCEVWAKKEGALP